MWVQAVPPWTGSARRPFRNLTSLGLSSSSCDFVVLSTMLWGCHLPKFANQPWTVSMWGYLAPPGTQWPRRSCRDVTSLGLSPRGTTIHFASQFEFFYNIFCLLKWTLGDLWYAFPFKKNTLIFHKTFCKRRNHSEMQRCNGNTTLQIK